MSAATDELALKFIPKATSLHSVSAWSTTTGSGSTVTVTVNESPKHPFGAVGVTVYSTIAVIAPVLVMVPVTFPIPVSVAVTPLTVPVIWVTSQV